MRYPLRLHAWTANDRGLLERAPGDLTLSSFLSQWLDSIRPTVASTSHRSYSRDVMLYIQPTVGGVKLARLGVHHIKSMYAQFAEAGKSTAMQRKAGVTLGVALQQGVNEGLISFNPVRMTKKPKHKATEIRPLDCEQVQKLLSVATTDRLYALYALAIDSGAREGELPGLQWQCVDLVGSAIVITKNL